jgi:uncharacterized protein DUF5069
MIYVKDLSKEPPRSPRERIGGYCILGRMIDKGRAALDGTTGQYEFNCGMDQMLFRFKGQVVILCGPISQGKSLYKINCIRHPCRTQQSSSLCPHQL